MIHRNEDLFKIFFILCFQINKIKRNLIYITRQIMKIFYILLNKLNQSIKIHKANNKNKQIYILNIYKNNHSNQNQIDCWNSDKKRMIKLKDKSNCKNFLQ